MYSTNSRVSVIYPKGLTPPITQGFVAEAGADSQF